MMPKIATRQKFDQRSILVRSSLQVHTVKCLVDNVPIDPDNPVEVLFREQVKARKPDQQALMWAGPLRDVAEQAWHEGRQYIDTVWHETFKRLYLPEEYDPELCAKESYKKWDFDRDGERILVGSTKELTIKGFSQYLEQVYADGASMGVEFRASPNELRFMERAV